MTSRQGPLSNIGNSVLQHRGAASSPYKPFSMVASTEEGPLPVFDLQPFLSGDVTGRRELAESIASCFHRTGACIVRDPRVKPSDQSTFLDMMERYFQQPTEVKLRDARPHLHYQVGVTPEGVEVPKAAHDAAVQAMIRNQPDGHRAAPLEAGGGADPKWRFMARIGPRPATTQYAELNAAPVNPEGFEEWAGVVDGWGSKMLAAVSAVAELAAEGFGLPRTAFSDLMALGPHLLAPTGADLEKHGKLGRVFAGFHSDLNCLTVHGKSRYPGLHIWLRNGVRVPVRIPDGCLLLQAGKQMEWLTGGHVQAGMHEVVCSEATVAAIMAARKAGRPLWRVSSTVFGHIASDQVLRPLGHFATADTEMRYPEMTAGDFVQKELESIRLKV